MIAFLGRPKWQKTRFLKMQEKVILTLTDVLEKIDDRFMTQIIFKMVGWKEEVVKSEGDLTKEGKIVQE
jgi:hypothetical protein